MSRKRVTLADVARRAGVSQTAASFVLSGRREEMRISADVEARVLRAAQEAGYRPNIVSRGLRTGTTQTIGFVSDTVATTPFAGHLIWGALDAARERDHLLFIGETEGDAELERQLIEAMHDRRVDGHRPRLDVHAEGGGAQGATRTARPSCSTPFPPSASPIPSVLPDEAAAGRSAARVLLEAGHADEIYLIGAGPHGNRVPKDSVAAVQRLQGINEAFHAAGVATSPVPRPLRRSATGTRLQSNAAAPREGHALRIDLLQRSSLPRRLPGTGRRQPRGPCGRLGSVLRRRRLCVVG